MKFFLADILLFKTILVVVYEQRLVGFGVVGINVYTVQNSTEFIGGFGWQDIDSSYVSTRACYYRYGLHEVMEGDILTAHYDHYGTTFDVTIPWEEASP